jgi:hypothetical protein
VGGYAGRVARLAESFFFAEMPKVSFQVLSRSMSDPDTEMSNPSCPASAAGFFTVAAALFWAATAESAMPMSRGLVLGTM